MELTLADDYYSCSSRLFKSEGGFLLAYYMETNGKFDLMPSLRGVRLLPESLGKRAINQHHTSRTRLSPLSFHSKVAF